MATTTALSVYHAIYGRRSAWKFSDRPVDHMAIERMLDAAVWAPNHRLTEPWRFFVLEQGSPERSRAAELAAEFQLERSGDQRRADAARQKVLEPPIVIYVYTMPGPDDETTKENYASVCIAAHNISLVLQRRVREECLPVPDRRRGASRVSAWLVRCALGCPPAIAAVHGVRTVPGAASLALPGTLGAG